MKWAFLLPYGPQIAGSRYRVYQYLPLLRQHGIDCSVIPFTTPALERVLYQPGQRGRKIVLMLAAFARWLPQVLRQFDAALVHREALLAGPPWLEQTYGRRRLVYDFDDAIYLPAVDSVNQRFALEQYRARKTTRLLAASHLALAGNRWLAAYAQHHSARTEILPTTVDTTQFCPLARPESRLPTLGWIGSHSTSLYLREIVPALEQLAQRRRFRLLVIGANQPITLDGVECTNRAWQLEREIADFQQLDIGLYPLPDSPWTRGKCGLKALQFGAVGIPTVCSPVGVNCEIVQHGVTGLHASSTAEWVEALGSLLDDAALRATMGAAARDHISTRYALHRWGPQLARWLHDMQ